MCSLWYLQFFHRLGHGTGHETSLRLHSLLHTPPISKAFTPPLKSRPSQFTLSPLLQLGHLYFAPGLLQEPLISSLHFFFFSFIFISWKLITLQYYSGFCHTLIWISHGFTCIPHPDRPSHLPLHLIPLGLPSAPGLSACLMHPTWAGDLFHPR